MPVLIIKTAAEFLADNDILLVNQIGQESDTGLTKVGYGAWNSLDYYTPVTNAFEQVLSGSKIKVPSSFAVKTYVDATAATLTLAQVLTNGRDVDATGTINDVTSVRAIDVNTRILYDENSFAAIGFGNGIRLLADNSETISADYHSRILYDGGPNLSVNWGSRLLHNDAGDAIVLDWTTNLALINNTGFTVLSWANSELMHSAWSYDADYAPFAGRQIPDAAWVSASITAATFITSVVDTNGVDLTVSSGALTADLRIQNTATVNLTVNASGLKADFASMSITQFTGVLGVANGGTNISSYAVGDILYASGATTLSKLADVAAGSYLRSGGVTTAPLWSTLILPNSATVNQIVYATSANTYGGSSTFLFDGSSFFVGQSAATANAEEFGFTKNQNAYTNLQVYNSTAGTAAEAAISVSNGTSGFNFSITSTAYTTSGMFVAGTAYIHAGGTNGINIGTNGAGQVSVWTTNTKRLSVLPTGEFLVGTATLLGSELVQFRKDQNAETIQYIHNATSGTAGSASLRITQGVYTAVLKAYSALYTTSGINVANSVSLFTDATAGLNLGTNGASPLLFWTNNTERARILSGGEFLVGGTTAILSGELASFQKNSNALGIVYINQATSGTAAAARLDVRNSTGGSAIVASYSSGFTSTGMTQAGGALFLGLSASFGTIFGEYSNLPVYFYTNSTERMRLLSTGELCIGNSTTAGKLYVSGAIASTVSSNTVEMSTWASINANYVFASGAGYWGIREGATNHEFAIDVYNSNSEFTALMISQVGVVKIGGTASRATTEGTKHLDIFDGTAPVGTLANGISLYSTAGELRVMDAAGNATLLSPHEKKTNLWIYDSVDTVRKKRLVIDMEKMMRVINEKFGFDFVHDFVVK